MNIAPETGITLGDVGDFPKIYEDVKRQFPPDELYDYPDFIRMLRQGRYKILLYRRVPDNELIGYALLYIPESGTVFWMDYLAVMKNFQSQGYGQKLFRAVQQRYCGPFDGMIFSVEKVGPGDTPLAQRQKRRIAFYEKLGAQKLHAEFLQPCENGSFPMHLYFKPKRGFTEFGRAEQMEAITQMYRYCYSQFQDSKGLLSRFKNSVIDEHFTG